MKIDLHAHGYPAPFLRKLKEYYPVGVELDARGGLVTADYGTALPPWDPELRIREMGEAGIDMEILSSPRVYTRVDEHSGELCRIVNDVFAAAARAAPEHFRAFAHVPFHTMDEALRELDRALALPGVVGVFLGSNLGGKYPHTDDFLPFWTEVARRRAPVFMHPQAPPRYEDGHPRPLIAFPTDTTISVTNLLYGGLFERFPDLVLILSHLGGTLPFLARRIDMGFEIYDPRQYRRIARRPSDDMSKLYLDTALGWHRPAFECARALVGIEHLVFGTDYGFAHPSDVMEVTTAFLDGLGLSTHDKMLLESGNARRLLGL